MGQANLRARNNVDRVDARLRDSQRRRTFLQEHSAATLAVGFDLAVASWTGNIHDSDILWNSWRDCVADLRFNIAAGLGAISVRVGECAGGHGQWGRGAKESERANQHSWYWLFVAVFVCKGEVWRLIRVVLCYNGRKRVTEYWYEFVRVLVLRKVQMCVGAEYRVCATLYTCTRIETRPIGL